MLQIKYNPWIMSTLVIAGLIIGYVLGTGNGVLNDSIPIDESQETIILNQDAVIGNENAPVVIEEFSDYQCPYCARYAVQTFPQINDEYIKTGKVKLIYKDFPLGFHPNAHLASVAAYCAGDQNKYWDMHNSLYDESSAWSALSDPKEEFIRIATDLDLNSDKFTSCLNSDKYDNIISANQKEGTSRGVTGTPAFFINGQKIVGAQPYSKFKAIIDAELAK